MTSPKATLITRLQQAKELSVSHRRIADCLIERMAEAAFWGVEELAERSQTSVATVVRFAQKLGYSGFLELRQALVAQAKKQARSGERLLQAPAEAAATLVEVARRDIQNIEQMVASVNEAMLEQAVEHIARARHRLILGDGVSSIMARHLAFLLSMAGFPCFEGSPLDFAYQTANLGSDDLLLALSLPPYSRETLDAAAFAHRRGVPVIAFTDRLRSPLARHADLVLPIQGENLLYSHSIATLSVLAHGIATALAAKDREGSLRKLREADRVARSKFTEG